MRTVRDFKNFMLKKLGVHTRSDIDQLPLKEFWRHLISLGWEKRAKDVHDVPDVDATAQLTDQEWDELVAKLDEIRRDV